MNIAKLGHKNVRFKNDIRKTDDEKLHGIIWLYGSVK